MGNPILEFGNNYKTNFTDAVAAGGDPVDCFNRVLSVAGLDDAGFTALPFSLPLDKWSASINATYKQQATVWIMLLAKLALFDKKIDVSLTGPFTKAKTVQDSMDIVREAIKTDNKAAVPTHLEVQSLSTGAMVGIGVSVAVVLGAIGYFMMKKED